VDALNSKVEKLRVACAMLLMLLGAESTTGAAEPVADVKIGNFTYSIPERHLVDRDSPSWLRLLLGSLKPRDEVNVVFSPEEVASAVVGYQSRVDLIATVKVLIGDRERVQARKALASDIWHARGRFAETTIERIDSMPGYYRVWSKGNNVFWEIVRALPEPATSMPTRDGTFWVASCRVTDKRPPAEGRCEASAVVEDVLIQFSLEERDFAKLDLIQMFVGSKVRGWRRAM
jgi:hypothetical protein